MNTLKIVLKFLHKMRMKCEKYDDQLTGDKVFALVQNGFVFMKVENSDLYYQIFIN